MPSKIEFQTWSGGSGSGDPKLFLGFCSEEPKEVLTRLYQDHLVYYYCDLYRPIDWNYPNNVEGLIIKPISIEELRRIGVAQTLSVGELDLNRAKIKEDLRVKDTFRQAYIRAREDYLHDIELCRALHSSDPLVELTRKKEIQLEEVRQVTLGGVSL